VTISRSIRRKALITAAAAVVFASAYAVTIPDSQYAAWQHVVHETSVPSPGARMAFNATAYCKGITTASGATVQTGVAASDPTLLPVGSVVQIESLPTRYNGIYTVLDTGPAVQGRLVDLYMWSCYEALAFGRKPIHLTVLRLGWSPRATAPGFLDRLFSQPAAASNALPSRPLPQVPSATN
jgi:3D (Asp-Asp-Asp) domain-containing protein